MKIGLTGGIGCGKSTVVRLFAELGWRTMETDAIVRELLSSDADVLAGLRERWGEAVFTDEGAVDRGRLAKLVFSSEPDLKWLESLLHPKVRVIWSQALCDAGNSKFLVEIPLLYEKSLESEFDFVVCVESPKRVVDQRMVERGYSEFELGQRRQRQLPLKEKVRRADFVLTNAGSLEFLEKQTKRLAGHLNAGLKDLS